MESKERGTGGNGGRMTPFPATTKKKKKERNHRQREKKKRGEGRDVLHTSLTVRHLLRLPCEREKKKKNEKESWPRRGEERGKGEKEGVDRERKIFPFLRPHCCSVVAPERKKEFTKTGNECT